MQTYLLTRTVQAGQRAFPFIAVSIWITDSKNKPSRDEATKKTNQPNWTYPNLNEFNALQFIVAIQLTLIFIGGHKSVNRESVNNEANFFISSLIR